MKLTLDDIMVAAPAAFSNAPHPRVSDKYKFFSTADVIRPMIGEGWFPSRCGQAKAREGNRLFTNHYVALTRDDLNYGDEQVEALLFNSHDGRKKLHFELGIFRGICANGCVWSDESFGQLNLKHLGYSPEQVFSACDVIARQAPRVINQIDAWRNFKLNAQERVALATFALKLRWPKNPPIVPFDLLVTRRSEDAQPTLWNVFNRIQEALIKGGTPYVRENGKQRTGITRAVSSIGTGLSINKRLWEGAQALSEGLALPA